MAACCVIIFFAAPVIVVTFSEGVTPLLGGDGNALTDKPENAEYVSTAYMRYVGLP